LRDGYSKTSEGYRTVKGHSFETIKTMKKYASAVTKEDESGLQK
jgi:hypothetical protein